MKNFQQPVLQQLKNRRASALLLVLLVISALTAATYSFSQLMLSEHRGARIYGRSLQATALAESGIELLKQALSQDGQYLRDEFGGLYDNPTQFRSVLVLDGPTPEERGRFTMLAPGMLQGGGNGLRYGVENESAKANLNVLPMLDEEQARKSMLFLPGMTEELADALLDWIDEDDTPRQFGAERDYYSGLSPPYVPRNGTPDTIEELLLVRGMTPALLFGPDANRNGQVDSSEQNSQTVAGLDNSTGELNRGLSAYLTIYSQERNVRPDGKPLINLNQDDLKKMHGELLPLMGEEMADYIIAARQFGVTAGDAAGEPFLGKIDLTRKASARIISTIQLIGSKVVIPINEKESQVLQSPFSAEPGEMDAYISLLMENVGVVTAPVIPGRININQAPLAILRGIPNMTEEMATSIINAREPEGTSQRPGRRFETWILEEGIVTQQEMLGLMMYITGGGSVFRAQVVGHFDKGGPAARLEVILDATKLPVRVLSWRDISHLGRGYSPQMLGTQAAE